MAGLYAAGMQVARIAIAAFLFFLAGIGLLAGISLLRGESGDLTETLERLVSALWLASSLLFAAGGLLLLRRPLPNRALFVLVAVLVVGGVVITVNPYAGPPLTAAAVLIAILLVAR